MLVVQSRRETVAPSLVRRLQGLAPQIRRLWRRIGKDCGWEHLRVPAVRWLWDERATGAVLEFLKDTRAGCRTPTRAVGHPRLYFPLFGSQGSRRSGCPRLAQSGLGQVTAT